MVNSPTFEFAISESNRVVRDVDANAMSAEEVANAITTEEIQAAADYFAALKPRSAIRVAEAVNAPKTWVVDWHLAVASTPGKEPLGQRIIEVPENIEQFERRDGRSRWVAYVPPGSVQRGQKLVTSGGGKTVRCGVCHGPDLKGLGSILRRTREERLKRRDSRWPCTARWRR
jgi:cytochrome c553